MKPIPSPSSNPSRNINRLWLWVIPVLLLAAFLGARGLNADAIWNDEFYSIHDAGGPPYGPLNPAQIWERVATRNPWHTPGYFIVLSGWGALVGWSPVVLRAFSLLVGLLGIAWTYRLGRELVSARVGVYAAAVLGVSAFFIHYMHELRMYTLFVLLTAFTVWVYLRIVRGTPTALHWLGLFAGALAMLYTHYFAALPVTAIGVYHLIYAPKTRRWWGVVGALALAGLAFVPWMGWLVTGLQMAADSEGLHERALSAPQALEALLRLFGNGSIVLSLGVFALALLTLRDRRSRRAWLLAVAAVAAVLVTNAFLEIMHEGRVRYLISAWALLAIVAGLGIARLSESPSLTKWRGGRGVRLRFLAFGALALWMVYGAAQSLDPAFAVTVDGGAGVFPAHELAAELRPVVAPDDVIVSYLPDGFPFWVYERNTQITQFYFNGVPVDYVTARTMRDPATQPEKQQEVLDAIGASPRLWLAYEPERPASTMPELMSVVDDSYLQCSVPYDAAGLRIELYARTPICCGAELDTPPLVTYDGIALGAIDTLPERVSGVLPVTTAWTVDEGVNARLYSVALHVTDAAGELVAQADFGLPAVAFACQTVQIDVSVLPDDEYVLYVIVYRWQDGARLTGTAANGETGERLEIGRFEVEGQAGG